MKEPYGEGLASHTGPESCVVVRKGRREALTGERTGWAIEPRKSGRFGAPTQFRSAEGHTGSLDSARGGRAPRGLVTPCTYGHALHGNREILGLPRPTGRVRGVNPQGARRR
jgi:RNA-directed DNA polymerase